jgi:hypothetical protein
MLQVWTERSGAVDHFSNLNPGNHNFEIFWGVGLPYAIRRPKFRQLSKISVIGHIFEDGERSFLSNHSIRINPKSSPNPCRSSSNKPPLANEDIPPKPPF